MNKDGSTVFATNVRAANEKEAACFLIHSGCHVVNGPAGVLRRDGWH